MEPHRKPGGTPHPQTAYRRAGHNPAPLHPAVHSAHRHHLRTGPHKRKAARKTSSYPAEGPRSREAACLDAIAETCKHNRHATVKDIANQLGITTTSTTTLLCRLEEKHLINYQRYKGASLTPEGTAVIAENLALSTSLCDLLIMAGVTADTPVPVAAQTSAQWTPVTLTDDYGYQITIDKEPHRIVSFAPANTEMIFALGLGDRVVGVTEYCNYPEEATTKPVIGGYTTVNIERVVAQKPDLVIAYYGNGEETVNHLRQLGLTVMTMNSDSVAGTFHDIELIGKATGKTTEAEQLTKNMQKRIDAVTAKLQGITTTPTAFHCVWADPLWVSGG